MTFEYPGSDTRSYIVSGEPLTIRIRYEAVRRVDDVVCGITIYDNKGYILFGLNTDTLGVDLGTHGGFR